MSDLLGLPVVLLQGEATTLGDLTRGRPALVVAMWSRPSAVSALERLRSGAAS